MDTPLTSEEMRNISNARLEWVRALRSGFYHQGRGQLIANSTPPTFCCLGVATLHFTGMVGLHSIIGDDRYGGGYTFEIPEELSVKLGLNTFARRKLGALNDDGRTFTEIADLIESLSDLFPEDFARRLPHPILNEAFIDK
jgi:hypothetical protein